MAEALSAVARSRGLEPIFVTRRGFRDNPPQYVPTAPGVGPEALDDASSASPGNAICPTMAVASSKTVWRRGTS